MDSIRGDIAAAAGGVPPGLPEAATQAAPEEAAKSEFMALVQKYGPAVIGGLAGAVLGGTFAGGIARRATGPLNPSRAAVGVNAGAGALGGSAAGAGLMPDFRAAPQE